VKALAARRRHPLAGVVLLMLGLMVTGGAYAVAAPGQAEASQTATGDVDQGEKLFYANCSTCHGTGAQGGSAGPSLIGVGAASVDFQVGTGRMPMERTEPQAPDKDVKLSDQDIADLAAFVASLAPGPAIPAEEDVAVVTNDERLLEGGELFRTNCAMCHNVIGAGGALTRGKYAPSLDGVSEKHIYEAMVTGPQSMPVFNDANITVEEKQSIISYLKYVQEQPQPGGLALGGLGPVTEGLFAWVGLLGIIIACTVWLGAKSS
jgi:ubiquinol-cytochrome c reductase cytochrome c subunit